MPKARKSARMWYARAQQFRAIADAITNPSRGGFRGEDDLVFDERVAAVELTRQRLIRESEKCWALGGKLEVDQLRQRATAREAER